MNIFGVNYYRKMIVFGCFSKPFFSCASFLSSLRVIHLVEIACMRHSCDTRYWGA